MENHLLTINYPGSNNFTTFTYDASSNLVKIVETAGGSVTSVQQFIFAQGGICEVRDASGSTVINQYFKDGETIAGNPYFFSCNSTGSVVELCDSSGKIQSEYNYDPFGLTAKIVENVASDFRFGGLRVHSRSHLLMALCRVYSPTLGRWLSRDPAEDIAGNQYLYANNSPMSEMDVSGLQSPFEEKKQNGAAQLDTIAGKMKEKCTCRDSGGCLETSSLITPCMRESDKIATALVHTWNKNFSTDAESNRLDLIGGLLCGGWAAEFGIAIKGTNPKIWDWLPIKYRADNTIPGDPSRRWYHWTITLFIKRATAAYCDVTVDDGYETGSMIHTQHPYIPKGFH